MQEANSYWRSPILMRHNRRQMADPKEARKYLEEALPKGSWAAASAALSHADTYIQQFIRYGKPKWLSEADRITLVSLYQLDEEKLRPTPKQLQPAVIKRARRHGSNQLQGNSPRDGKFVDDPGTLDLLGIWERITDPRQRVIALRVLEQMTDRPTSAAASGTKIS